MTSEQPKPDETTAPKRYRTRSAVRDNTENSARAYANKNGVTINLFQVRGGYEARAAWMGAPKESHRLLATIEGKKPPVAPEPEASTQQPPATGQPEDAGQQPVAGAAGTGTGQAAGPGKPPKTSAPGRGAGRG